MAKTQSIGDAILEMQKENERLKSLEKVFDKAVKEWFGYDIKTLQKMINNQERYEARKAQQGQRSQTEQSEV